MATPLLEGLRAALAAMPPGALVPRDWLLEQLTEGSEASTSETSAPATVVDLTIPDLAQLFGKRPSTVRAWVERGDFPGAYKLHGREWRVPPSAVAAFQDSKRRADAPASSLKAWRSVVRRTVTTKPESGPQRVTKRSPPGNAED